MTSGAIAPEELGVVWVRFLNYNTHVGQVLRSGGVRWLLREFVPHVVTLQEVQSAAARAWARATFDPVTWSAVGMWPASDGRGDSGTLVFARRAALKKIGHRNPLVSPFLDQMHPERSATAGVYEHRRTGQVLDVGSVHTWATGDLARPIVRRGHTAQLEVHQRSAQRARALGHLPFRAGDWNERINGNGTTPAEQAMREARLVPARPRGDSERRLDEVFVPLELATRNYRTVPMTTFAGGEGEHRATVVDVAIPRKAAH